MAGNGSGEWFITPIGIVALCAIFMAAGFGLGTIISAWVGSIW